MDKYASTKWQCKVIMFASKNENKLS